MGIRPFKKRKIGFVLIELLLAISLLLLLFAISLPGWHTWIVKHQMKAWVCRFTALIEYARVSAVTLHQMVRVCGSADVMHCDGQWSQGQLVITTRGKVLRKVKGEPQHYHLTWESSLGQDHYLVFTPWGFTQGQQGSFYVCRFLSQGPKVGTRRYCHRLVINHLGRLRRAGGKFISE